MGYSYGVRSNAAYLFYKGVGPDGAKVECVVLELLNRYSPDEMCDATDVAQRTAA